MGEAKRRLHRQQKFLKTHPWCIYCGAPATTTDHCPPRCFFEGRQWPETYEFPACQPCNADARLDEQALAVLVRSRLTETGSESDRLEWEKLAQGVKNNQPQIVAEWTKISRNETRHGLRLAFGGEGDQRRQQGWGLINVGPLTQAMTARFMVKLGKCLYYRHNGQVFDGALYIHHINRMSRDTTPEYMSGILQMAPELPTVQRNKKSLLDQFIYRFNHSPEHGVMYAVVQFGEQFIFQLIAVSRDMDAELTALAARNGMEVPAVARHECFLLQKSEEPSGGGSENIAQPRLSGTVSAP